MRVLASRWFGRCAPVVFFAAASLLTASVTFPAGSPRGQTWGEELHLIDRQPEPRGPGRIRFEPRGRTIESLLRARAARVEGFPLPDGWSVDLEVAATDTVNSNTRFVVADADGIHAAASPPARLFRGTVAGDPDSLVSLNLIDGHLAGFIRTAGEEYTFGPRSFARDAGVPRRVEVVDESLEGGPAGLCDGEAQAPFDPMRRRPGDFEGNNALSQAIGPAAPLVAYVAVEGTVEWVARHGGVTGAISYTLNLLAQVSAIYENDVNVEIQVPYILMNAAENDGYTGTSNDTGIHLSELRSKWNGTASLRGVFRSMVHLFGLYPSGGAGRAYLDVLCDGVPSSSNSYDFGVSLLQGAGGSWERRLVAHELGHNFSSPHSHCYVPELDRCHSGESGCYAGTVVATTGDVMSYCSAKTNSFHQRVIDERLRPGAMAAHPSCVFIAGSPGMVGASAQSALVVSKAGSCVSQELLSDDNGRNGSYGYAGSSLAAWVKRFTPACYPFALNSVQVRFGHTSVAAGRPVRILVYTDTSPGGSPATAVLAHTQDVTIQSVGTQWNTYTLSEPVLLNAGDYYVGFQDLLSDSTTTYIIDYDSSRTGDSFHQGGGTAADGYTPYTTGSWLIRAQGGGVAPGSVVLSWGPPCNDAAVPDQDFAIYQGTFGDWDSLTSLTCTTGGTRSWVVDEPGPNLFWLVVPQTSANEGSYGISSLGERPPAAIACRPQSIGTCAQ